MIFYLDVFVDLFVIVKEDYFVLYKFVVNKVGEKIYGVFFDLGVIVNFNCMDLMVEVGYIEEDMENLRWDEYI